MTDPKSSPSRREFLKTTAVVAAATAVSQAAVPLVHAGESHLIQVAWLAEGVVVPEPRPMPLRPRAAR